MRKALSSMQKCRMVRVKQGCAECIANGVCLGLWLSFVIYVYLIYNYIISLVYMYYIFIISILCYIYICLELE